MQPQKYIPNARRKESYQDHANNFIHRLYAFQVYNHHKKKNLTVRGH